MSELLATAIEAARVAGALLRQHYQGEVAVRHKGTIDLVTDADGASEAVIVGRLSRAFPEHAIWGEEGGMQAGPSFDTAPVRWIIDPLDGTTNFAHRLPHFCVLLAAEVRDGNGHYATDVAVTYDPMREELFVAKRGAGATLNGRVIRISDTRRLIDAALATGFAYDRLYNLDDNHREFCRLNLLSHGVRRFGSAGLDLAYTACGRFDGFWERGLKRWDVAGGVLLVEEAGGQVTTYDGAPFHSHCDRIVASNGHLHPPLLSALASAGAAPTNSRTGLKEHLPAEVAAKLTGGAS